MELLGQHRYQLDAKGRIALPRKFAEAFGEGVYLTLGQDDCLWVFPKDEWDRRSEEIRRRPLSGQTARAYSRMFFGFAERMDLDGQGRMVIPQRLRAQAELEREVVVMGLFDHLEIWPARVWDRYEQQHAGAYRSGSLEPDDG